MRSASGLLFLVLAAGSASADCGDVDASLEYWRPIREQALAGDTPVDGMPADEFALALLSCLGSPNPELRDGIGYELLTHWLRNAQLSDATRREMLSRLGENLSADATLLRSFSALILAELMRSDGNDPFMTADERAGLLGLATDAMQREDDYRGLDASVGWVHPVAHLADLLWRFALHPGTDAGQADIILAAVRSQVAPTAVAYSFNEGDRLARVVATIIRRDLLPADKVAAWISAFQAPRTMERWSSAFTSPEGMAELHNTKQFLRALSDQLDGAELPDSIGDPLSRLVQGFTQLI